MQVIDKISVVMLETKIWTGARRLHPEDIFLGTDGKMPPEDVASLGSKKICDPKALNVFQRLSTQMERECFLVGTRFLRGYAIPDTALTALTAKLDALVAEFLQEKTAFLASYESVVEKWIASHVGFEDLIRRSTLTAHDIEHRIDCGYSTFRIGYAPEKATEAVLDAKVGGLSGTLYREIATEAKEAFQGAFTKGIATRRIFNPIRRMVDKLDGLSFLNEGIRRLVDAVRTAMDPLIHGSGPLTDAEMYQILSIANLLSSVDNMQAVAGGLRQIASAPPETVAEESVKTPDHADLLTPLAIPDAEIDPIGEDCEEREEEESFFL